MGDVDVYGIARLYIEEYGDDAAKEIQKIIAHQIEIHDTSSLKRWYEIEEAIVQMHQTAEV